MSGGTSVNRAPGYMNLAPPMLTALDPAGAVPLNPAPPAGWGYYPIPGAVCRDGSPTGVFVRFTQSDKLYVFLEGGGACTSPGFCNFNPSNANRAIAGTGETVIGSALGTVDARQQPGVFEFGVPNGVFDFANPENPVGDWNMVYVPYCTGDVHFGANPNGSVPGVPGTQQFVGFFNMQKIIGHVVPTFPHVNYVIMTGTSAGSYGAALNASMVQDAFGDTLVEIVMDSGPPFSDQYMPPCMVARWRALWNYQESLPPDCTACFNPDGGGLVEGLSDFLLSKHPNSRIALVSSIHDEVIRLFFSSGLNDCANFETIDPVITTLGALDPNTYMPEAPYEAGLNDLRARYMPTGRFATYFMGGANHAYHQHTWRARFYQPSAGGQSIAQFLRGFLEGRIEQVGP